MSVARTFDHDEARRLYGSEGWSQREIAEHFGKSKKTIQLVCQGVRPLVDHVGANGARNLAAWHVRKKIEGAERRKLILALHDEGLKQSQIAARVGISTSRVGVVIAEARAADEVDLPEIEVPRWVPPFLGPTYIEIGTRDGEEAPASHCRRLKAEAAASCR